MFETRAWDLVWEDPRNPLATEDERTRWQAEWEEVAATNRQANAETEATCVDAVERWLSTIEKNGLLEVQPTAHERTTRALGALLHRRVVRAGDAPETVAVELAKWMYESPFIEEIYATDLELRARLTELAHRV
ncbi:MAG: hypothetical protein AB8I08_10720 [Sandaracinaceae bacterium]